MRKRLFCAAKQPLLPCKTYAFGTQNNRFYNTLIYRLLYNSYSCEKCLHFYYLLSVHKIRRVWGNSSRTKKLHFFLIISLLNYYRFLL
ncbi:hypothetical protein CUB97_10770 [Prevotella intermedia]|uniref:Uncharacterized protein n=1 Tax=Prevotella intermedia TaxID=28131 RepID=A0A2M8M3Q9_PREIN|nr:hypothetical protein CUB97_10770 [Prevotella intermedia]